jgi:hypothetical protein
MTAVYHKWKASTCKSLMLFRFFLDQSKMFFGILRKKIVEIFVMQLKNITLIMKLKRHRKILDFALKDSFQEKAAAILSWCLSIWKVKTFRKAEEGKNFYPSIFRLHNKLVLCVILMWRFKARSSRLLVVSGIRVFYIRKQNLCRLGIKMMKNTVICRKFMIELRSRLTAVRARFLLSVMLDRWCDFMSSSQIISSCSRRNIFHDDFSLTIANFGVKDVNPGHLNQDSPNLINDWNGYIKALKARDMIIEMQESHLMQLKALLEEKETALYQREQSIAIRDKWLEQLSIENQVKDSLFSQR